MFYKTRQKWEKRFQRRKPLEMQLREVMTKMLYTNIQSDLINPITMDPSKDHSDVECSEK